MNYNYDSIQLYILNWKKVNNNSIKLYNIAINYIKNVKIVNCDENLVLNNKIHHIQLNDSYYYGGQFNECLKDVNPDKILGIIVGDTIEIDFENMFKNLLYTFKNYRTGVYTIYDKRSFHSEKNKNNIERVLCKNKKLMIVKNSDCGVWFINPDVHKKIKSIDFHKYSPLGWGIDIIANKESIKNNLHVIRDDSIQCDQIDHKTNYSENIAREQQKKLLEYYNSL